MQKSALLLGTIAILALFSVTLFNSSEQDLDLVKDTLNLKQQQKNSVNFLLIGDYGSGNQDQENVAVQLNEIATQEEADFIVGAGDNFYDPNGVYGLDDPAWHTKWADVYQSKDYLHELTWYGTIGNHDYGGDDLYAEFHYNENRWVLQSFFWTHYTEIGDTRIAFVHVDTSFLAYGIDGQSSKPNMKKYFEEQGWTNDDQIIELAENELRKAQDADWIIAVGHHPVGGSCPRTLNTHKLYSVFEKYNVSVYLSGHVHQLAYSQKGDMGFVTSGAGSYYVEDLCLASLPKWSKGNVFGFMGMKIYDDYMDVTAYYIDKDYEKGWQEHSLPALKRRI